MPKKTYTDEFKTDAVNYYYDSGLSINTTAKKLGVSISANKGLESLFLSRVSRMGLPLIEIMILIKFL